ncbi:MAG: xseB [Ilumatobacteraceae bacterium]|nr:xseB [Ilumatobacteraceae bacterium]
MSSSNPPATPGSEDRPGYAESLAELERILAELERDNVDVDRLASQVQRAAELIGICRERIGNARMQIEHVVADLSTADTGRGDPGNRGPRA